jgi:hypothetical protein
MSVIKYSTMPGLLTSSAKIDATFERRQLIMSQKLRKIISPLLYATGAHRRASRWHPAPRGGMTAVTCYHCLVEDNGHRSVGYAADSETTGAGA